MLASQIVTNAYVLSGIVGRGLNSVSAQQSSDGIMLLNLLLAKMVLNPDYIPYYTTVMVNSVQGQEKYFLENVAEISTVTFLLNNVRYALTPDNRKHYYGASRANNISSLPFDVFWERTNGGSNVYFYFFPSQSLVFNINCKLFLSPVTLDTELNNTYDLAYQDYITYLLAQRICQWNKISVNPEIKDMLKDFQQQISNINPKDFTCQKTYSLSKGQSLTYADVNFGRGWTTP